MIPYSRDTHQTVPPSAVKIIGLGGAGANMLEHIALDGMDGAELLALNTDIRTLGSCLAKEKIQLGINLTKGLGAGGDPELGHQAVLEAEGQIRAAVKNHRIVFLCTGLGGGTGSGAAPIVTRIAREEGAFVVVFATMPFEFEGKRRRDQAETALNELAVLSNALVTFDNNRMGELVLAKQGIHEAFVAADHMISESIKAVIRLVVRPGLINVGLDDLMSALRANRSRCLFGSGLATGKDRATKALQNALSSPLLDQGALLKEAQTVLVHLCGGENLTLCEIELVMQRLQKFVPDTAHVLFGAAVDPMMGDSLSLTLISALPEDSLAMAPREALSQDATPPEPTEPALAAPEKPATASTPEPASSPLPQVEDDRPFAEAGAPATKPTQELPELEFSKLDVSNLAVSAAPPTGKEESATETPREEPETPATKVAEFVAVATTEPEKNDVKGNAEPAPSDENDTLEMPALEASGFSPIPRKRPPGVVPLSAVKGSKTLAPKTEADSPKSSETPSEPELPRLKLGVKSPVPQSELSLDSSPRGRFEGEKPNVFEGEDLDLPPFLRKKK